MSPLRVVESGRYSNKYDAAPILLLPMRQGCCKVSKRNSSSIANQYWQTRKRSSRRRIAGRYFEQTAGFEECAVDHFYRFIFGHHVSHGNCSDRSDIA
jgi:hypothetical protein